MLIPIKTSLKRFKRSASWGDGGVEVTHRLARWQRRERQERGGKALCAAGEKERSRGNRPSSMAARPTPFIYLTPSSSAGTSVSGALTHSMPETIWFDHLLDRAALSLLQRNGGRRAALSSVSSERTFGFARRVAALHLENEQQKRRRVALAFSGRAYRFAWWRSSTVSRATLLKAEQR